MNARLYNPRIGRFFSPDNYITDPENPQNYNRYSYALNNPLSYVDPSGNEVLRPDNHGCSMNFSMGGLSLSLLSMELDFPIKYSLDVCKLEYYVANGSFYTFAKYLLSPTGGWGARLGSEKSPTPTGGVSKAEIAKTVATDPKLGEVWSKLKPSTRNTILNALYEYYNDVSKNLDKEKCVYEVIGEVRKAVLEDGTTIEGVVMEKSRDQSISEVWANGIVHCKTTTRWLDYQTFPDDIFNYDVEMIFHFHPPDLRL